LHYGVSILRKKNLVVTAKGRSYSDANGLRNGVQWIEVIVNGVKVRVFTAHIHAAAIEGKELATNVGGDPSHTLLFGDLNGHADELGAAMFGAGNYQTHKYFWDEHSSIAKHIAPDALVNGGGIKVPSFYTACRGVSDHPFGLVAHVVPQ
jgi:hypothetical protein